MKKTTWMLVTCNVILALTLFGTKFYSKKIEPQSPQIILNEVHTNISLRTPEFLIYEDLVSQLHVWEKEAPDLVEVKTYGKSFNNKDLFYLRICKDKKVDLPKVLITACIHGNEPWSTGCTMAYIGNLLAEYEENEEVKELILTRDIYFVPVVSPDTYASSRNIKNIDPNRDFPTPNDPNHESIVPIKELQELFLNIRPDAVLSGHTFGRMYLYPYGDNAKKCPDHDEYVRVSSKMAELSNYQSKPCHRLYKKPILGTEMDWYYRNGSFAMVVEFGTHQSKPTHKQIESEFQRTWSAFKFFLKEAPLVYIKCGSNTNINFFVGNAGIDPNYLEQQKEVLGIKSLDQLE